MYFTPKEHCKEIEGVFETTVYRRGRKSRNEKLLNIGIGKQFIIEIEYTCTKNVEEWYRSRSIWNMPDTTTFLSLGAVDKI